MWTVYHFLHLHNKRIILSICLLLMNLLLLFYLLVLMDQLFELIIGNHKGWFIQELGLSSIYIHRIPFHPGSSYVGYKIYPSWVSHLHLTVNFLCSIHGTTNLSLRSASYSTKMEFAFDCLAPILLVDNLKLNTFLSIWWDDANIPHWLIAQIQCLCLELSIYWLYYELSLYIKSCTLFRDTS